MLNIGHNNNLDSVIQVFNNMFISPIEGKPLAIMYSKE